MRFSISQKLIFVLGLAVGSLLLAGQLLAQTPTSTNTTTDPQTQCTTANGKWCLNSDGGSGWCSYGTAACPAYDSASCSAQSGEWCANTSGGGGWCATPPSSCPINDKATCESKSRNWCAPQSGGSGWCTYSSTEKCPAYTETDCKAQSRTWCVSPGTASTSGWCTDSCPYSSSGDQKTQCTTANGKWCLNSDGASGYCSYGTSACPAYNAADCSSQGGDWCAYSSGSGGYCNATPNSCPINDKASCEAKSRKWCSSSYGGGWCAMSNENCPSTTPTPTTPTPDFSSWPMTESDCGLYSGLWCKSTGSYYSTYTGSCMMANNTCPTTPKSGYMTCWDNTEVPNTSSCPTSPTNEADCTKTTGRYWCKSTYPSTYGGSTSSGWCQGNPCSPMPPAGQMTCPDGKTFASNMSSCPKKSITPTIIPEPVIVLCPDGITKTVVGGTCPAIYTCPNGTAVKSADQCPKQEDEVSTCLNKGNVWCKDPSGMKSGWCAPVGGCGQVTKKCGTNSYKVENDCPGGFRNMYAQCYDGYEEKQGGPTSCKTSDVWQTYAKQVCENRCSGGNSPPSPMPPFAVPTTTQEPISTEQSQKLSDREIRTLEREKKSVLRDLATFEKLFKKASDEASLAKIAVLRSKLEQMAIGDSSAFEYLQAISDDVESLRQSYRDVQDNGGVVDEQQRDKKFEERALKQMKQGLKSFEKFFNSLNQQAVRLEKQGVNVGQTAKGILARAKDLLERGKAATTYDEMRDIMDQLPNTAEDLNDLLARLNQLSRLPEALKLVNRRLADGDRAIKQSMTIAKRLGLDAIDEIQKMQALLAEARAAAANLKTGAVETDDFLSYIADNILDKVDDVAQMAQSIQMVASVKQQINKISADLKRYERRLVQLERKGEDMGEVRGVLDEAKAHLEELRKVAAQKLNADLGDQIIEHLEALADLRNQLEEMLKLMTPGGLEQQLKRLFEQGGGLKPLEVSGVEKAVIRAYSTANFYKMSPERSLAVFAD